MSSTPLFPLFYRTTDLYMPGKMVFGLNSLERLSKEVRFLGGNSKVLVMTDKPVLSTGSPEKASEILKKDGFEVKIYDNLEPEPRIEVVEDAANFAKDFDPDVIVGIGGGSVMDSAKLVAASFTHTGKLREYVGPNLLKRRGKPIICIPTTAGTGSEVTQYAVFTIEGKKKTCASPYIIPDVALVDPLLTLSLPSKVTAGCGLDALSHAIESLISTEATPITDELAYLAIRLIFNYLKRAYYKPNDVEARYYMSMAATIAGIPLCNARMVVGHSISQTIGPMYKISHGISCAITLPYIMKFYVPVVSEKLAQVAIESGEDVTNMQLKEAALMSAIAVKRLLEELNIPHALKSYGVPKEILPKLAEDSITNFPRPNSPIELNKENVLRILEWMYEGEV
ncbi:MAG: iron-containing alcohol dehydrogenase [Nitrososphaeria archaeon]|nr:iron-containing alcohol dehydrogenase [Nitrososphaeria archaeon]